MGGRWARSSGMAGVEDPPPPLVSHASDEERTGIMAQGTEQTAAQLEKVTARLEQLARRQRGGPLGGLKPFLLGVLTGAGAALLYAPQAGEQSRTLLRRNATELQERATQSAQSAKGKIQERTGAAQETAQESLAQAANKVRATVQNGRSKTQPVTQDAKQAVAAGGAQVQAPAAATADEAAGAQEATLRTAPRPQAS